MDKNKISIGTVQFAVNAENNSHLLIEHPLGSISRMIAELISQRLSFIGIDSEVAKLIVTKPEEKGHKQLIYTSMLPLETAKKILETRYFDYCLYGEINFDENLKIEISLLDSNEDKNLWRREIKSKNYDFSLISKRIIEETFRILKLDINISGLDIFDKFSTESLSAWGWYSVGCEDDLDIEDKILALEKALEISPEFAEAKLKLISYKLAKRKYFEEANKELKEIKSILPREILKYYADILFNQGKFSEAEHFYTRVDNYLSDNEIVFKLLKIYFEQKNILEFNNFLELYLNNSANTDYQQIGYFLISSGQVDKAKRVINKAIESNNNSAQINAMSGFINMIENNYEKAAELYQKSFSLDFNVNILEDWSSVLLKLNRFEDIKQLLEKYSDDLIYNSGIECNLAIAYLNTDNMEKAIKILEKTVKKDKANARANALLGNIYFKQKSYARAQKYLTIAINSEPDNYNWYKIMGDLFFDTGDIQESLKYYDKATTINPDLKIARLFIYQGDQLRSENKLQEAFNRYNQAIKLEPELIQPRLNMAKLCVMTDDYDKAIELLEKSVEKFPDSVEAWHDLSEIYLDKSKGLFKKAWKIKAEYAQKKYQDLLSKEQNKHDKDFK